MWWALAAIAAVAPAAAAREQATAYGACSPDEAVPNQPHRTEAHRKQGPRNWRLSRIRRGRSCAASRWTGQATSSRRFSAGRLPLIPNSGLADNWGIALDVWPRSLPSSGDGWRAFLAALGMDPRASPLDGGDPENGAWNNERPPRENPVTGAVTRWGSCGRPPGRANSRARRW
jgi:hypothetical protein